MIAYTADEEDSAIDGAGFLADRHRELFEGCTEGIGESGAFTVHPGPGRPPSTRSPPVNAARPG